MPRPPPLTNSQKARILADREGTQYIDALPEPPLGTTWIGGYRLGGGSFGEVTLWMMVDNATNKAIKHCAIKDSFEPQSHSTEEKGFYRGVYHQLVRKGLDFDVDPERDLGNARREMRFCKEAYLQGIMTEPKSSQEIFSIPLWGYSRRFPSLRGSEYNHWRLYMPLYDYGTMEWVIHAHKESGKGIPEPFIWHTLYCLFSGAVQLQEQAQKREGSTPSDIIVVFDMKPANILLAPPLQKSTFPIYPRPHIADLGGGCLTSADDLLNRECQLHCQTTTGFVPPELFGPSVYDNPHTAYMGCHDWTNVWQIARVAEAMMKLKLGFDPIEYRLGKKPEEMEPEILNWQGKLPGQDYSEDLKHLLSICLKFDLTKRPSSKNVLRAITKSPVFLQHREGLDTFGNDAWFEEQQRKYDEKKASGPPPSNKPPTPEETEAATKKRKRLGEAHSYLRAWEPAKRAKFLELGVLPDERFDLEYPYNEFWSTDPLPKRDERGDPVHPLQYRKHRDGTPYLIGHTASFEFEKLGLGTGDTAVEGADGAEGDDELEGDDGVEDDDDQDDKEGEDDGDGKDDDDDDEDDSPSPSPPFLSIR